MSLLHFLLLSVHVLSSSDYTDYTTHDVYVPTQCDSVAKAGDHLLLEYRVVLSNGTVTSSLKAPSQLFPVLLEASV